MKPSIAARPKSKQISIQPRVKLWLELDGKRAFCPGVCRILREIERTGSIKEAAVAIGRSYRFVWGKVKQVERAVGSPLVETRVGGSLDKRSAVTPLGLRLTCEFEELRQRLFDLVDGEFAPRLQLAIGSFQPSRSAG